MIVSEIIDEPVQDDTGISDFARATEKKIRINVTEDAGVLDNPYYYQPLTQDILRVGKVESYSSQHLSWFKFNMTGIPSDVSVISARIYVCVQYYHDDLAPPVYAHYCVNDSWDENTIMGVNYPKFTAEYSDKINSSFKTLSWYSWSVNEFVEKELDDNRILSLVLSNHNQIGEKGFFTKEIDQNRSAYLEIRYHSVSNSGLQLLNGNGDGKIVLAGYKHYEFSARVRSFGSAFELDSVILVIDPDGLDLKVKWDVNSGFTELEDFNDHISIVPSSADYASDMWTIKYAINFNLDFPLEGYCDVKVECWAGSVVLDADVYRDVFVVKNRLLIEGDLQVTGEGDRILSPYEWVRGGEKLRFSGLKFIYQDDTSKYPAEDTCRLKVTDKAGNFNSAPIGKNGMVDVTIDAFNPGTAHNSYYFSVVPEIADNSSFAPFRLKVDDMMPGTPAIVTAHADSLTDKPSSADNDDTIYLSWSTALENGSGLRGYYYGEKDLEPVFTADTSGIITDLSEGTHVIEVYAEDNVGNIGGKKSISIVIDTGSPEFSVPFPDPTKWSTNNTVMCSITIIDKNGSGIDKESIEYSIKRSDTDEWRMWQKPDGVIDAGENTVIASKRIEFPDGEGNQIKWRAIDCSGNGPVESESIDVMVDTEPVHFSDFLPADSPERSVVVELRLEDTSGIASCEYRIAYGGEGVFTGWKLVPRTQITNDKLTIQVDLPFGDGHRIQFRAKDVAGNPITISDEYTIRVNSIPEVVISSPEVPGVYKTSDWLIFDASRSTDADNDTLNFRWESNLVGLLGTSDIFNLQMQAGTHEVTLMVFDQGGHVVNSTFKLKLLSVDTDSDGVDDSIDTDDDGDGMPDYWEMMYKLDPLKNDALKDNDGDGYTNREEYNAGTNPSDSSSKPKGLSSSMVSTIVILLIIMMIIIVALGLGFILYRRHVKKKLIVPELITRPEAQTSGGVKGEAGLDGLPVADASADVTTPTQFPSERGKEIIPRLPEAALNIGNIIDQLDWKYVRGEISKKAYLKLRKKYTERLRVVEKVSTGAVDKEQLLLPSRASVNQEADMEKDREIMEEE